jgi:hypothetical protein
VLLSEIRQILAIDAAAFAEVTARLVALEEGGPIRRGYPYWQNGEYLYLVHPQIEGKRFREYVGNKKERVAAALAEINRRVLHGRLTKEKIAIERRAARIFKMLTKFIRVSRRET